MKHIKPNSMKQTMRHLSRHLLQSLMVVLMVCGVSSAWAQTNYVFYNDTYGYLYNNGTNTVALSSSFSPACVWVANAALGNNQSRTIYSYSDNTKYLRGAINSSTLTLSLGESNGANSWRANSDILQYRNSYTNYYVKFNGSNFVANTNNDGYRFTCYQVTISTTNRRLSNTAISGGSSTFSAPGNTTFTGSSSYTPEYTNYRFNNNANHYVDENGNVTTTAPTSTTDGINYTWSLSGIDPTYASVENNGVVTCNELPLTQTTATLTLTATHTATGTTATATRTITIQARTFSITTNSADGGTFTASAASASSGTTVTLTATPNTGYELYSWSVEDADGNAVTVTNNQFTMPASNVTVSAVFGRAFFPPTPTKPYVLQAVKRGNLDMPDDRYLNPRDNSAVSITQFSNSCILYFEDKTSSYYAIRNTINNTNQYASTSNNGWSTTCTTSYDAAGARWKFVDQGNNQYKISSVRNTDRYLGCDATASGSSLYYNKPYNRDGSDITWKLFAYYSITITGNPSAATATIRGTSCNNGYYLSSTATVSPEEVVPAVMADYESTVTVDDDLGTITIVYKKKYSITDISTHGSVSIVPSTSVAGKTITLTASPATGYLFTNQVSNWTITDASNNAITPTIGANNTCTFTMPESNVSVSATFVPAHDPSTLSVTTPLTVYKGATESIVYELGDNCPCYANITYSIPNTANQGIANVNSNGVVTGVAVGQTSVTVTAHKIDGSTSQDLTATCTIIVRDKVATPVISFTPNTSDNGATASVSVTCETDDVTFHYKVNDNDYTTSCPTSVSSQDIVKVYATKNNDENHYYDQSDLAELMYTLGQVPTPEIHVVGNRIWFTCDLAGVTYYYTDNGNDPTTSITQWNGQEVINNSTSDVTIKVIAVKPGYSNSEVATKVKRKANIVYLQLGRTSNGDGSKDNPVNSWSEAYKQLGYGPNAQYLRGKWAANSLTTLTNYLPVGTDYSSTVDNNIIYLVGDVSATNFNTLMNVMSGSTGNNYSTFQQKVLSSGFMKPVTISGKYATSHSGYSRITINQGSNLALNEDTRFEYVEFYQGDNPDNNSTQFLCGYYDLEMGDGIRVNNFLSTYEFTAFDHGFITGTEVPHILIYGGYKDDSRFGTGTQSEANFENYLPHPSGYKIKIHTGYFSTISPGGTQWQTSSQNSSLNGTMGGPSIPLKCTILIDIDHAWNENHKDSVLRKRNNQTVYPNNDISAIIGGTHEGSMYGDVDIIIKSGRVGRVVNGTLGANKAYTRHPADTYAGRARIVLDPREPSTAEKNYTNSPYQEKDDMVVIQELYGGGLGRFTSASTTEKQSSTYFYGESSVVINGGTIQSALYASGAGGINGIGDAAHHTLDPRIPYLSGTTLSYGNYDAYAAGSPVIVSCHASRSNINDPDYHTHDALVEKHINLSKTNTKIDIHGGHFGSEDNSIEGIFGGGYGWVHAGLINYPGGAMPNQQAGSIFAKTGDTASTITIDGKVKIYGNVYGGGRGSRVYYDNGIGTNGANKALYKELGVIAGNVFVNIEGNAEIHGNVYGGGLGIEDNNLLDMAHLYGTATINIRDKALVTGNIYGGGANGRVTGNTIVNVINGQVGTSTNRSNIHGGGHGVQTRVSQNIDVNIAPLDENNQPSGNPLIYGDVYGGSALGLVNGESVNESGHTNVTMNAGTVYGAVYGGGLGNASTAANVWGPVTVTVNGGTISVENGGLGAVFGCNNVNGQPKSKVNVNVNGGTMEWLYGGGNAAPYTVSPSNSFDNFHVFMKGGHVKQSVFGGGFGADAVITGNTEVKIIGPSVIDKNVYGGGNGGDVTGDTNVVIGEE